MLDKVFYLYSLGKYTTITTIINVIVGLILIGILYYLVRHNKINIKDIYYGTICWIILGISIRFSNDVFNIYLPWKLLFITPFVYIEVYFVALISYFLIKNKHAWCYIPLALGSVILLFLIPFTHVFRLWYGVIIITLTYLVYLFSKKAYNKNIFSFPITFQTFDGLTTFISITYLNFYEEHIIPTKIISFAEHHLFLIHNSGAWLFLLTKLMLAVFIVEILKRISSDENKKEIELLLWFIAYLGLATGFRNLLNILFV